MWEVIEISEYDIVIFQIKDSAERSLFLESNLSLKNKKENFNIIIVENFNDIKIIKHSEKLQTITNKDIIITTRCVYCDYEFNSEKLRGDHCCPRCRKLTTTI